MYVLNKSLGTKFAVTIIFRPLKSKSLSLRSQYGLNITARQYGEVVLPDASTGHPEYSGLVL